MRRLVYSMSVSLDGYVETAGGSIDFTAPSESLHAYFNDEARKASAFLYGRRMYELMAAAWPDQTHNPSPVMADFARIWLPKPKYVFSRTLSAVEYGSELLRGDARAEIERLKGEGGDGDLWIGGPSLVASVFPLIDEFRLVVRPVVLGGGKPFFPPRQDPLPLRLLETRTFDHGVLVSRYAAR